MFAFKWDGLAIFSKPLVGHEESVPEMSGILSVGDVDRHAAPNHFVQQNGELGLGLDHQVGNGLKWDPPQEAER